MRRNSLVWLLLLSTVALTGCTFGNSGSSSDSSDSNSSSNSGSPAYVTLTVPGPNFAGGNQITITVAVANDQATDSLSATGTLSGAACSPATCGTFGNPTGTAGSGSYTMTYVPPASVAATTTITLSVSSNLASSFAATVNFPVYPAHSTVVTLTGVSEEIVPGSTAKTLTATVYNDTGNKGVQVSLLGGGFACPPGSGGTVCGKLATGTLTTGTTTTATTGVPYTQTPVTYTPPSSGPASPPYDRPIIFVASVADTTAFISDNFLIGPTAPGLLFIPESDKLDVAVPSEAVPATLQASLGEGNGVSRTVNWSITAGGANCSPQCGSLAATTYVRNGGIITATTTYTPPASLPTAADTQPTITVSAVDANTASPDSFTFNLVPNTCATNTGNNGVLSGQYAFLLRGGSESGGYITLAGSFTADGNGNITGGFFDNNGTHGPNMGVSIVAGSSYTVGSDNRGCLILQNANGGIGTYRIALGTLSGGVATQGQILRFDDDTGSSVRGEGIIMQQQPSAFAANQFMGNYAVGLTGVDYLGGRIVEAGLIDPNGSGTISNVSLDMDDNGVFDNGTGLPIGGSATYSLATGAANGRGTGTISFTGGGALDFAFYAVSSSEFLFISTDYPGANVPVLSGEMKQQTGAGSFGNTSLDGASYVFYASGIDNTNGGNATEIGQVNITSGGAGTITEDVNDNGTEQAEAPPAAIALNIATYGRVGVAVGGSVAGQPILYLVDTTSAFWIGTDKSDSFGFVKKQVGGPFSNSSLSGQFFFGGTAPQIGGSSDIGTVTLNGSGNINGNDDESTTPAGGGLQTSPVTPATGGTYSFSSTSNPVGKGSIGSNAGNPTSIAYVISTSEAVFMLTGNNGVELYDARK